jgi:hypothetical protein
MWCVPTGLGTTVVPPPTCRGCPWEAAHGVAEYLQADLPLNPAGGRYALIPEAQRPSISVMRKIASKLWLLDLMHRGLIGADVLYNLGPAADNGSQSWTFEVLGGGPGYIDIRGPNPKFLPVSSSRVNPSWPFADPVTGTYGRLVFTTGSYSLPAGSQVRFLYPSALADRVYPIVSRVLPPSSNELDDVTFRLEIGGFNATNATQPWDAAFPPADGKYWCEVRVELLGAQVWKDYQTPREIQFVALRASLGSPTGEVELLASDGTGTRVLFPGQAQGSFRVFASTPTNNISWGSRLRTDKVGPTQYRTWLDFTGLQLEDVVVEYYAEARAGDAGRVPVAAQCRHAKVDPTGSWVMAATQHCAEADRASGVDEFHEACWLPGKCDRFSLVDPLDMDDAGFLASLWSRAGFVLLQQVPGFSNSRNFYLAQRGGPSIQSLAGSFADEVPGGFFEKRVEWAARALGKRVQWSDGDGNQSQGLIHGAWWLSPHRFPESAEPGSGVIEYWPDANGPLQQGIVAELVPGWADGKVAGDRFPWRYSAPTSVYDYSSGQGSLRTVNTPAQSEAYITAVELSVSGSAEARRLRALYGGS